MKKIAEDILEEYLAIRETKIDDVLFFIRNRLNAKADNPTPLFKFRSEDNDIANCVKVRYLLETLLSIFKDNCLNAYLVVKNQIAQYVNIEITFDENVYSNIPETQSIRRMISRHDDMLDERVTEIFECIDLANTTAARFIVEYPKLFTSIEEWIITESCGSSF